jgi:hypothetical protein
MYKTLSEKVLALFKKFQTLKNDKKKLLDSFDVSCSVKNWKVTKKMLSLNLYAFEPTNYGVVPTKKLMQKWVDFKVVLGVEQYNNKKFPKSWNIFQSTLPGVYVGQADFIKLWDMVILSKNECKKSNYNTICQTGSQNTTFLAITHNALIGCSLVFSCFVSCLLFEDIFLLFFPSDSTTCRNMITLNYSQKVHSL